MLFHFRTSILGDEYSLMLYSLSVPNKSSDALKNDTTTKEAYFSNYYSKRQAIFSSCSLKDFSSVCETLRFIEYLDLSRNVITNIPTGIERYGLLTTLDLSFNKIFAIPNSLCKLRNLRILLISNNYLSSLPESISELKNLQELDLSSNKFKCFPCSVCSLHSLKVLLLGCNLIEVLPEDILGLRCLKILDLHSNNVKQLPLNIRYMWCLEKLSLEENPLCLPLLSIVARGIPYIFAFLNQQALCNSNNTSCERFHDSLTQLSSAHMINGSNQQNTMKLTESHYVNSDSSSPCFEKPEVNTDSVQISMSKSEITNPSSTTQHFDLSTSNKTNEQFNNQNVDLQLINYNYDKNFSHNESTHSYINETLKSASSFSSLSTDENESLTMDMFSSAYENVVLNNNDNESDYVTSNDSQQLTEFINNSQIKQPVSSCNGNEKKTIVSAVLNESDSTLKSSAVQKPNSYTSANERSYNSVKPANNVQIEDNSTDHSLLKYDRRDKYGHIPSLPRSRSSKRQQITHDKSFHHSSGYITPDSYLSENYNLSQINEYDCQNMNQYHQIDEQSLNQINHNQIVCDRQHYHHHQQQQQQHLHKTDQYAQDIISNQITHNNVTMPMPTECTLKFSKHFKNSLHNYHKSQINAYHDTNIPLSIDYFNKDISKQVEIENINQLEYMKMNSVNNTIKWDELNSDNLIKINQLRKIIDKELNIRLPVNPKHLAIELSTGVILIHLLNKFIGLTSNIKVCVPRNDRRDNMLSEVLRSYRQNLRRCRELIYRYGVPREYLFSIESIVNPQTANGLLSLANSISILHNLRNNKSSMNTSSTNKLQEDFDANTGGNQYNAKFSQAQSTSSSASQQPHRQQQQTKQYQHIDRTENHRKMYQINIWSNYLCSDV
ncbi:unnamed protein product [Schistosoma turkestanicum]|nr:unnamed protein product [Schistosoma turkestanicum]